MAMTEAEAVVKLAKLLEGATKKTSEATGACVYTAGTKTNCAVLSKSDCDALKGIWTAGGKC